MPNDERIDMYTLFSVLILIVCLLLVLIVLVQNSKGGGLAGNFAEAGQVMGVRKTADFLEKATWTLAISLVVLTLFAVAALPNRFEGDQAMQTSRIARQVQRTEAGVQQTALPEAPESDGSESESAPQNQEDTPEMPEGE